MLGYIEALLTLLKICLWELQIRLGWRIGGVENEVLVYLEALLALLKISFWDLQNRSPEGPKIVPGGSKNRSPEGPK